MLVPFVFIALYILLEVTCQGIGSMPKLDHQIDIRLFLWAPVLGYFLFSVFLLVSGWRNAFVTGLDHYRSGTSLATVLIDFFYSAWRCASTLPQEFLAHQDLAIAFASLAGIASACLYLIARSRPFSNPTP